jgi:hypothetical protein
MYVSQFSQPPMTNSACRKSEHENDLLNEVTQLLKDILSYGPEDIKLGRTGNKKVRLDFRCVFATHNSRGWDRHPSAWALINDRGGISSGCWVCNRRQVTRTPGGYTLVPTLYTLSRRDPRLLDTLNKLDCEETLSGQHPCVSFPVAYADGAEGAHLRIRLEGKRKWRHQEGRKAAEAVFGLHKMVVQRMMRHKYVVIAESPMDSVVLVAAGIPSIAVLGKENAKALGCPLHRQTLLEALEGGNIFVWVEPDASTFAQQVANALQLPVKALYVSPGRKDAFRVWLSLDKDWERFGSFIHKLLRSEVKDIEPGNNSVTPGQSLRGTSQDTAPRILTHPSLPEKEWIPFRDITAPDPEKEEWQVEELIKLGNLVILAARPKIGKSIVGLNLAACIASGRPFLGRKVTQGRAMMVPYERPDLTVKRARKMGLDMYDSMMVWDRRAQNVAPRVDQLDWWREFIEQQGPRLIVFDTLAHFLRPVLVKYRGAICAYDPIYEVLSEISDVANHTGCTIVLIHHDRKGDAYDGEQRVLGTTALTAVADVIMQIDRTRPNVNVIALNVKGNDVEDQSFWLRIQDDYWICATKRPAATKEERAAREVLAYLRKRREATRQELVTHLIQCGLANPPEKGKLPKAAENLLDRAIRSHLVPQVAQRRKGRKVVYYINDEGNPT